jgi:3-oxoacyl-[acyl-carrier-protein] synthase-3
MRFSFSKKKISGILSVVPRNRVRFEDEFENYGFSRDKMKALKKVIGIDERRIVRGEVCTSDLCQAGLEYLIEKGLLKKEDIDAMILITQTPDHFMPPTSNILHGKLGLGHEVVCFDINQGCSGYLYGLLQAFLLLEQPMIKKVLLLAGDTLSRRSCIHDRNIYPLIGDAGSVTILENTDETNKIHMNIKSDGARSDWLIIPAGAFRLPSSEKTRQVKILPDGNRRSEEDFYMNGPGIFLFTQTDVPMAIKELFEFTSIELEEIDYFIFHQANRFILEKLAEKLGVPKEKMPNDIVEKYGNSSSATIPVTISHSLDKILLQKRLKICLAGFGVGLSWGTLIMDLGPLAFCELIEN